MKSFFFTWLILPFIRVNIQFFKLLHFLLMWFRFKFWFSWFLVILAKAKLILLEVLVDLLITLDLCIWILFIFFIWFAFIVKWLEVVLSHIWIILRWGFFVTNLFIDNLIFLFFLVYKFLGVFLLDFNQWVIKLICILCIYWLLLKYRLLL